VANASSGDTIEFSYPCLSGSPITLASVIDIAKPLTIFSASPEFDFVSGNNSTGVFEINSGINASISGLTIEAGKTAGDGAGIDNEGTLTLSDSTVTRNGAVGVGGGIQNLGTMIVSDSTLSDNHANGGGAIYNDGTLTISNSTLSDNSAEDAGGAIYSSSTLTVSNSTLSGNNAYADGGGIDNGGPLSLTADILDNNAGGDCLGPIPTDDGYNIADDVTCGFSAATSTNASTTLDSTLGQPADNGGFTATIALFPGSPAIDKVSAAHCPATDQRGATRTAPCDIGAFDTDGNPVINKFTPSHGNDGKKVTITGKSLSGATEVIFNGTATRATTDTATKLTVYVPPGATTGRISVTTSVGGTVTSSKSFTVT
jgi:predicted outer membrane repeat protein